MRAALSTIGLHLTGEPEPEGVLASQSVLPALVWDKDAFAEEQIRGLVRQVFFSALHSPVQQVVFSPVEQETDVRSLCRWVGEALGQERTADIAVVDESELYPQCLKSTGSGFDRQQPYRPTPLRQSATRIHGNVWSLPPRRSSRDSFHSSSLCVYMAELRREFEYSIVATPASTLSSKALEMARFADGIILVLSAEHTRRVTALKVKNALGPVRLLGNVLSDREFPMPTSIYRRL